MQEGCQIGKIGGELSSLRSQLEYWNDGIMGDLVLNKVKEGKCDSG